jgi:hypothetical protein
VPLAERSMHTFLHLPIKRHLGKFGAENLLPDSMEKSYNQSERGWGIKS